MSAGYSGTPLVRKLGIRPGARVAALNAPDHLPSLLADLPEQVELDPEPPRPTGFDHPEARSRDVVLLFAADEGALSRDLEPALRLLAWDGGLWIAWPKRSSSLASDLGRDQVRVAGLGAGLVDNKICAVDDDWSALRLVYRLGDRP